MTDPLITTRRAALGMGAATLAVGMSAAMSAPRGRREPARYKDPVWNREQAARLQAHIDGRQVFGRCSGTINGVRPGEAVRTLFNFEVFSTIRVVRRPDGNFDRMSKEVVFYTDPKTGAVLEEWDNPYTGERVKVVDIANDPYNWVIRDWVGPPPMPGTDSHNLVRPADAKPFLLHWSDFSPDTVIVHEGGHAYYPNRLDPDKWPRESAGKMVQASELFRYFIRREDLENPKLTYLPHNGVWLRITPWLPWMLMGKAAGHILYEGEFCGNETTDYHKPQVMARVKAKYPQYLEAPTKWYGPSLSSLEHYALEQKPAPVK
jgi:Protein of unknown function (DUF1838)